MITEPVPVPPQDTAKPRRSHLSARALRRAFKGSLPLPANLSPVYAIPTQCHAPPWPATTAATSPRPAPASGAKVPALMRRQELTPSRLTGRLPQPTRNAGAERPRSGMAREATMATTSPPISAATCAPAPWTAVTRSNRADHNRAARHGRRRGPRQRLRHCHFDGAKPPSIDLRSTPGLAGKSAQSWQAIWQIRV
jgi:hypothetical protein